jgi:ABC-2 type transport system ATP-binding protein
MDYIVNVKHLIKHFGTGKKQITAVNDISFTIKKGEIVGLLGPNGAGKTTTIQMILGLITPTSGEVEIFGKEFKAHREEILTKVNFSSSYTNMPWRLSVWENLYVVSLLYNVKNPKKRVDEVIKQMNLSGFRNNIINDLSSGWITRVNLARTFLNRPKLLLLDEPTASLDPESAANIRKEIINYQNGNDAAILWTSHNMAEVEEVCDRVIFLKKGKIIAVDTPQELAKSIKTCRISFMPDKDDIKLINLMRTSHWKMIKADRFVTIELKEQDISDFLQTLSRSGIKYTEISIEKPTLEDYFISAAVARKKNG